MFKVPKFKTLEAVSGLDKIWSRGAKIRSTTSRLPMDKITDVTIGPMPQSQFLKPQRLNFKQGGVERFWDFCTIHESVSSIVYNTTSKKLIMVKQFRPAVFYSENQRMKGLPKSTLTEEDKKKWEEADRNLGMTIELCAGICDKDKPLEVIMQEEIWEECGYKVPLENIQRVCAYRSGVGSTGDKQNLFYAEVTDKMKESLGGGNPEEGEFIQVIEMTIDEVKKYISQDNIISPGGFLFAIHWFLNTKYRPIL